MASKKFDIAPCTDKVTALESLVSAFREHKELGTCRMFSIWHTHPCGVILRKVMNTMVKKGIVKVLPANTMRDYNSYKLNERMLECALEHGGIDAYQSAR